MFLTIKKFYEHVKGAEKFAHSVGKDVKELRKENEELKSRLDLIEALLKEKFPLPPRVMDYSEILKIMNGHKTKIECLWDSIPEKDRLKPMGMSCACPKCTPSCC